MHKQIALYNKTTRIAEEIEARRQFDNKQSEAFKQDCKRQLESLKRNNDLKREANKQQIQRAHSNVKNQKDFQHKDQL